MSWVPSLSIPLYWSIPPRDILLINRTNAQAVDCLLGAVGFCDKVVETERIGKQDMIQQSLRQNKNKWKIFMEAPDIPEYSLYLP